VRALVFAILAFLWIALMSFAPQKKPENVVALAPSYCETMQVLGLENLLVGVSSHCDGPEFKNVAKVGSFLEPNFEAILALNPALVLAVPHPMAENVLKMLGQHTEIYAEQPDSLADIYEITESLAQKFGVLEKGRAVITSIRNAMKKNSGNLSGSFLFAVSANPLVVAGSQTYASEILEGMGLVNLAQSKVSWPIWSIESLLTNPPDIFLIDSPDNLKPYQDLFKALGVKISILVPKHPLFQTPSPKIIEDIIYLNELFAQKNHE
jgi:iron complex transport system substrate-binding protein